jgi:hypothetical protein
LADENDVTKSLATMVLSSAPASFDTDLTTFPCRCERAPLPDRLGRAPGRLQPPTPLAAIAALLSLAER